MSHYREHLATVSETTGDANPNNQVRNSSSSELGSASEVSARISDVPVVTSTENVRVRVSSEGDAGPATKNHAEAEKFDDYVGCERNGGGSRDLGHGFEVGDMVWGKVKSHPWWPGHIYDEAFASPAVLRTKREGHVLVAFFGDSSYGWFEPGELIPFDANFAEKSRQTNSRTFLKALEEAVDEASRRCALGLLCRCRNPYDFCPTNVQGYFSVNVPDYEPGVYSDAQIRKARNGFGPIQTLAFIKQLALAPYGGDYSSNDFAKNKATVVALRRVVFERNDETYAQAFGVQPFHPSDPEFNPLDQPVTHPNSGIRSYPPSILDVISHYMFFL
ncbi:PWWP domain [Sesbania bispinosa]|nr:PWWP domain [Sesbania bispinosa]